MDMDIFLQSSKKKINYLDIGGDIDLYLKLNNKLNIMNYYILNFKDIIDIFRLLKKNLK